MSYDERKKPLRYLIFLEEPDGTIKAHDLQMVK